MKAYGTTVYDWQCCAGHSLGNVHSLSGNRPKDKYMARSFKKKARHYAKIDVRTRAAE